MAVISCVAAVVALLASSLMVMPAAAEEPVPSTRGGAMPQTAHVQGWQEVYGPIAARSAADAPQTVHRAGLWGRAMHGLRQMRHDGAQQRTKLAELDGLPTADVPGLSRPVAAPLPFSLLGFSLPPGAAVEVRTSADGRRWTSWEPMERLGDDAGGPDPGGPEGAPPSPGAAHAQGDWRDHTEPLWVGAATWLQVRVEGAALDDVRVHLVDTLDTGHAPLERTADLLGTTWRFSPAHAGSQREGPPVVRRHEWGADERWRRAEPTYSTDLRGIVIHHTAGSNSYSREEAPAVVRAIYAYHTRSLGWNDIGYNLLVDRFGTIYEGRAGGLEHAVIGAHTGGFNSETTGIALMGMHSTQTATDEAFAALVQATAWKAAIHDLDPLAWTTLRSRGGARHPRGQHVDVPVVSGHRTLAPTACPGDAVYARMQDLRDAAQRHMEQSAQESEPLLRRLLG
jgi:hypothetical protein